MPLFKAISSVKDKLTLTPSELLIKEATSNDDSLVSTTTLHAVADMTFQPIDYPKVMETVWGCLRAPRQEWRRIQRAVLLSDVLMKFGSSRCVQELRDFSDRFKGLQEFRYTDDEIERGAIIREKSRYLVEILVDFGKIEVEREVAKKQKNKCVGMSRDDVYRGKFKKNSSYEDVKGYYNVALGNKFERPVVKEEEEEEEKEKKVMEEVPETVIRAEKQKVPEFERASYQNPPVSNVFQPALNSNLPGYYPASSPVNQPVSNNVTPQGYYSAGLTPQTGYNLAPAQGAYAHQAPPQQVYSPAPQGNFTQSGPNPYMQNINPIMNQPGPVNMNYSAPVNQGPHAIYSQVGGPANVYPQNPNSNFNPYNMPYPQAPVYNQAPNNPYQNFNPPMPAYNPGPQVAAYGMQKTPTIKHNMSNTNDHEVATKPAPNKVDLESLLMNLDGLQANPKLK